MRLEMGFIASLAAASCAPAQITKVDDLHYAASPASTDIRAEEECWDAVELLDVKVATAEDPCSDIDAIQGAAMKAVVKCARVNPAREREAGATLNRLERECRSKPANRVTAVSRPASMPAVVKPTSPTTRPAITGKQTPASMPVNQQSKQAGTEGKTRF